MEVRTGRALSGKPLCFPGPLWLRGQLSVTSSRSSVPSSYPHPFLCGPRRTPRLIDSCRLSLGNQRNSFSDKGLSASVRGQ